MTDPELQAAMQVLSVLTPAAYFTDFHLFCLLACRMVKLSMQHGMSGASAHAYAYLGSVLGTGLSPLPRRLSFRQACLRPGREARLHRLPGEGLHCDGNVVAFWTQPLASAIDFTSGDLSRRDGDGRSDLRLLRYDPICSQAFSCGTIRSTRCGASRRWRWTSPGKPSSAMSRTSS